MNTIYVIKRDGRKKEFNRNRILFAVQSAINDISYFSQQKEIYQKLAEETSKYVEDYIVNNFKKNNSGLIPVSILEIEDLVISYLNDKCPEVSKAYKEYRDERSLERELNTPLMLEIKQLGMSTNRDNANVGNNFSAKLLNIASAANKKYNLAIMPKTLRELFNKGFLYYHDLDSFNLTMNCLQNSLKHSFENGFNTGYGYMRKPHRIESAAALMCILLQSCQNDQFGGISISDFDTDMAEYVDMTRIEIKNNNPSLDDNAVEELLQDRVRQAMQAIVYNLNTMHSRAGAQVPFTSLNVGLFEELQGQERQDAALILKIFLEEYQKGLGRGEQPIFPSIIYRVKNGFNANPEDEFYWLTKLAAETTAKRMNPTYVFVDCPANEQVVLDGCKPTTMGCRTCLHDNVNGKKGSERRGNAFPVTLNIPRLAIIAKEKYPDDEDKRVCHFFDILLELLSYARKSCLYRYDVLKELKVKDLPFDIGQNMYLGSEGLSSDDSIEPVLKNNTIAIGFFGLAETLVALIGHHHGESKYAQELGLQIVRFIYDYCEKIKKEDKLNYSCYFTPAETCGYKMMKKDKEEFGVIEGVTDKEYYTNSIHIPVGYPITSCQKLKLEGAYHKYGTAGRISYVELDDRPTATIIERIISYTKDRTDISYLGINFRLKYCKDCGSDLNTNNLTCPHCGSGNIQGVSRVTGYLSLDERFGAGKDAERRDRISHDGKNAQVYRDIYNK
ncbi:MAG TPA: anaerobic ribonucleoside-triphosphate reductase [Firmicutes bacterium]|nr:anaerobic ribonucleoside-triphosphate reductase [Bacillota bacterium]